MDLIDPALLQHASPEELKLVEQAYKIELAKTSPLNFAVYASKGTAHPHLELLDGLIVALVDHRLYIDGPGPQGVKGEDNIWRRPGPDGLYDEDRAEDNAALAKVGMLIGDDLVREGELVIIKLAISMPPRHGKSYLVSEHLPAWFITKWPDKRVILASYEAEFAASWGLKARRLIENFPEFGVELDPSSRSGAKWDIKGRRGGMVTAGAGGPITGKGGDILIGDDLVKNDEEANSAGDRDKKEDWWTATFSSRRQPGGDEVYILMATRWHEDDILGRITKNETGEWYVINLPALAFEETNDDGISVDEENDNRPDPLGRKPGEALAPKMFSSAQLRKIRDASERGKIWFSALFQGRPTIGDAGMFARKNFRTYRRRGNTYELKTDTGIDLVPLSTAFRFITVDLAASKKTSADWTVFSAWDALPGGRLVLVDRWRMRLETPDHVSQLVKFVQSLGTYVKIRFVGIESATYGLSLIQNLIRHPQGFMVRPLEADTDKESRALLAGQAIVNHQVFFPEVAEWRKDWDQELVKFPKGAKDDQVDTLAYAVQVWVDLPITTRVEKAEPATMQERVEAHVEKLTRKNMKGRRLAGMLGRY